MHIKLDRMLVVALGLLHSAVSQMTLWTLSEAQQDQLQAKLLDLDPLRKVLPTVNVILLLFFLLQNVFVL